MRCDLLNYHTIHTRLVKFSFNFVCPKIISREYFCYENLLDEIKANYGTAEFVHAVILLFILAILAVAIATLQNVQQTYIN